jgi:type I restriction enzyme, S subunit
MTRGEIDTRFDANFWRLTPLFRELFSRPLYQVQPLGAVVSLVQYGCSALATDAPVGVPMLRMTNLQDDGWDLRDLKFIALEGEVLERYRLLPGDLLFNRTNSKELVGKCAVFREPGDWVFASYLIRVRLHDDAAMPQFVADFLNTRAGRLQIDRFSRQIIGMTNINAEELKDIVLPVPPLVRQRELTAAMDRARAARRVSLAEIDVLLTGLDVKAQDVVHPGIRGRLVVRNISLALGGTRDERS